MRRLDAVEGAVRISPQGGFDPRWRADGRELFYLAPQGEMVAAEMPIAGLRVGRVTSLFALKMAPPASPYRSNFVVTADGQRFLARVPLELPESRPVTLTLNWTRRLQPKL